MRRYQVYLNPDSVSILDEFEKLSNISRSKVIRSVIDRVAEQLVTVVRNDRKSEQKYVLDSLAGFIDLKTDKKTNFAQSLDDIYLKI